MRNNFLIAVHGSVLTSPTPKDIDDYLTDERYA